MDSSSVQSADAHAVNIHKFSFHDHPVPSCFFSSVSFLLAHNASSEPLNKVWWDHQFIEQGVLKDNANQVVSVNLAATPGKRDDYYSDPANSSLISIFREVYDVDVKMKPVQSVSEYMQLIDKSLANDLFSLVIFPKCQQTGIQGFDELANHFCVITQILPDGQYVVQDQETTITVGADVMRRKFAWALGNEGFLPWYEISLGTDDTFVSVQELVQKYSTSLEKFHADGARLLETYCTEVSSALAGGDRYLQDGMLWTIPLCRRAEIFFLQQAEESRFRELIPLLREISIRWNLVLLAVRKNLASKSAVKMDISRNIQTVKNLEHRYFEQVREILADLKKSNAGI